MTSNFTIGFFYTPGVGPVLAVYFGR